MTATITPLEAGEALGLTPFDLARLLRERAESFLTSLAYDIRHGGESNRGDVERDEYDAVLERVWRLVEAAKVCDAEWQSAYIEDPGE
jgi:hypothetical protein